MAPKKDERIDLGHKLREMLDSGALDAAVLAKECGVSRQAVYGWIKTGRVAKEHLPVFARLSGKPLEWWLTSDVSSTNNDFAPSSAATAYNVKHLPETRIPVGAHPARRVYVVGRANGGLPERVWTDGGYLVGATEEFAVLATDDPHAFLTSVIGSSMAPVYNPGDFAFVEPGTEIDLGDDVLVRLQTGETMLKRLLVRRAEGIQLGSYGEHATLFYRPEEVTWMYYVAHPVRRKKIKTRF